MQRPCFVCNRLPAVCAQSVGLDWLRFVVWLVPSKDQVRIYQKALETSEIIHEANSTLVAIIGMGQRVDTEHDQHAAFIIGTCCSTVDSMESSWFDALGCPAARGEQSLRCQARASWELKSSAPLGC